MLVVFFFFKQKTAYEMRISDWSSDVCSSDLLQDRQRLLEAKSSLGLIVGEILHEGAPSANFVATSSARLKANWNSVLTPGPRSVEVKADFPGRLDLLAQAGVRLRDQIGRAHV